MRIRLKRAFIHEISERRTILKY